MHRHGLTWLVVFAVVIVMFLRLPAMVAKQDSVVNTYRTLVEVDALAKQRFVEPIEDRHLVDGAIRGMLSQLDPYSGYLAPDELVAFEQRSAGGYIGIGIDVGMLNGQPTVIAASEDGPGAAAGVAAGDVILAVDGRRVENMSVFDIGRLLRGTRDTQVNLTVLHTGQDDSTELSVTRGAVTIHTVRGFRRTSPATWDYLIDPDRRIGYIRINRFHVNTMPDFESALDSLLRQKVGGIVIDLRFNPGGLLDQAVDLVDRFVSDGLIVSTVTRRQVEREYYATAPHTLPAMDLVVLVNGGSASAAEIVAGSLQDRQRAVVVGERSFGKGCVQLLMYLTTQKAGVMLTTTYYRLPSGRIIHRPPGAASTDAWGVHPDVKVRLSRDEKRLIQESRRQVDSAPLVTGDSESTGDPTHGTEYPEVYRDRQLLHALAILSGEADVLPESDG